MYVNCAHGKGIKFIREELKFFAKTNTNSGFFKSIILSNADKLTIDGQSALRRCIELFSHNTRFFIIVEDKYKLLKPILSRFCEIYLPLPIVNDVYTNLNKYHVEEVYKFIKEKNKDTWLKKNLEKAKEYNTTNEFCNFSTNLYEKGYSALDLMDAIEKMTMDETRKYQLLLTFNKVKREFRNEKLLILFILNFLFIKPDVSMENLSFI
jgi:hypothetical protein